MGSRRFVVILMLCSFLYSGGCTSKEQQDQLKRNADDAMKSWYYCVHNATTKNAKRYDGADFVADLSMQQCAKGRVAYMNAQEERGFSLVHSDKLAAHLESEIRKLSRLRTMKIQKDMDAEWDKDLPVALEFK
ncbi:MAG: hypothetical protein Q8O00_11150 [Holophaga sp.]|nr:hypothetical protein [Holophaga sp.]